MDTNETFVLLSWHPKFSSHVWQIQICSFLHVVKLLVWNKYLKPILVHLGLSLDGSAGKESGCSAGDPGDMDLISGSGEWPWRSEPTPVFFLEKSHGQRSLAGYSPNGCQESDVTEHTHTYTHTCTHTVHLNNIWKWMNFTNIVLSKRQQKKSTYYKISFI